MASTSVTTVGGLTIVTQVIPSADASIPLQDTPQAPPIPAKAPPTPAKAQPTPIKVDDMTATFLRAQPHALGVVQIVIGLLIALFSLTAIYSWSLVVHAPFCLALMFVYSGSVAVSAGRRTSIRMIWANLVSHSVSILVSLMGVAYDIWLFASGPPSYRFCDRRSFIELEDIESARWRCSERLYMLNRILYGIMGLILVLLVLQICVSVVICVFSGKAIKRRDYYPSIMADIHSPLLSADHCSDDALLDPGKLSPPNSP
ncbi:uncharacterized protein KZ484_026440 [Pholidichthys leucotaenia]